MASSDAQAGTPSATLTKEEEDLLHTLWEKSKNQPLNPGEYFLFYSLFAQKHQNLRIIPGGVRVDKKQ